MDIIVYALLKKVKEKVEGAVLTVAQSLTTTQKTQARNNIGAIGDVTVNDTSVVTDGVAELEVINVTNSTETDKPLSANMGKELQTEINNLKNIGRFLAIWNCATGLPATSPTTIPYPYKTGDYYRVGTVSSGTNYRPTGSSYTGNPSTTVESEAVAFGWIYYYDGNVWYTQPTGSGGLVQDVEVNGTSVLDSTTGIANITDGALSEVKYTSQSLTNSQKQIARTNISALTNSATGAYSVTIEGNATTRNSATNIGANSTVDAYKGTAYGCDTSVTAQSGTALGNGASVTAQGSVQLGQGTNSTANTLQFQSYQIVDGNGKIPNERIYTTETYTVSSGDWSSMSGNEPFGYSAEIIPTHTIGTDTVCELVNNDAVLFANYGFAIGDVAGQGIEMFAVEQPSTSVTLRVEYYG